MKKRTIYKYSLKITDRQKVEMPYGAGILTAQMQGGIPLPLGVGDCLTATRAANPIHRYHRDWQPGFR